MKVTHLKSATVMIETKGIRVLTDPWLTDGEYYGSWYHVPPYERPVEELEPDYIYCSHIHPDHFSRATYERLPRRVPVLIHDYASKFLKRNIEAVGFTVIELPHGRPYELGSGVSITILAADDCNPMLCGKFLGCSIVETKFGSTQIDSLSIIDDGRFRVLNVNDCPFQLAEGVLRRVVRERGPIDLLLVGYAGAGPYPQCVHFDDPDELLQAADRKRLQFLTQALDYLRQVRPRYFLPFAGTYVLGGRLWSLNATRGVPEIHEARNWLDDRCRHEGLDSTPILLDTCGTFDLTTEHVSKPYVAQSPEQKWGYVERELATRAYDFDKDEQPDMAALRRLAQLASSGYQKRRREIDFASQTPLGVGLAAGSVFVLSNSEDRSSIEDRESFLRRTPHALIDLDPRLLWRLLSGQRYAHWNNAEVGSHLTFHRRPDQHERALYHCLYFFHG